MYSWYTQYMGTRTKEVDAGMGKIDGVYCGGYIKCDDGEQGEDSKDGENKKEVQGVWKTWDAWLAWESWESRAC